MLSHMALSDPRKDRMAEYYASVFFDMLTQVSKKRWDVSEVYSDRLLAELRSRNWDTRDWYVRKNYPNLP
jgi:hypothetical protein